MIKLITLACVAACLFACSVGSELAGIDDASPREAAPDARLEWDAAACIEGARLTSASEYCVALEESSCCPGLAEYRCEDGGLYSASVATAATLGPHGSACARPDCARARQYDGPLCGGGEAYECPRLADGTRPMVNITGTCWTWNDGGAPARGEAPVTCCP